MLTVNKSKPNYTTETNIHFSAHIHYILSGVRKSFIWLCFRKKFCVVVATDILYPLDICLVSALLIVRELFEGIMFVLAYLFESKVNLVVPSIWIKNFDAEACINHGLNRNKIYQLFYSSTMKTANFNIPLKADFSRRWHL